MPDPNQPFWVVEAGHDVHVDQQRGHGRGCLNSQKQGARRVRFAAIPVHATGRNRPNAWSQWKNKKSSIDALQKWKLFLFRHAQLLDIAQHFCLVVGETKSVTMHFQTMIAIGTLGRASLTGCGIQLLGAMVMKPIRMQTLLFVLLACVLPLAADAKSEVTAIDILLEPDSTMLKHADASNARLLAVFPKGFALDAEHRPHITLIQRFVRTEDLDKVYAAAEKVLVSANVNAMKLEAFKYYYAPAGAVGVAGICAKPTQEIIKLQADIIAAVKPFTVETGTIEAFTAAHDDPANDAALIQYASTFVPNMSGDHFNPHVSTGVAPRDYLDKMNAEPFQSFVFSPAGAAVYQLGPFGTAAKKLKAWDLKP